MIIAALGKVILHKKYLKDRPESRITLSAKQNKKLRGVIEHNVQDHDLTLTAPWKNAHDRILRSEDHDAHIIPE